MKTEHAEIFSLTTKNIGTQVRSRLHRKRRTSNRNYISHAAAARIHAHGKLAAIVSEETRHDRSLSIDSRDWLKWLGQRST